MEGKRNNEMALEDNTNKTKNVASSFAFKRSHPKIKSKVNNKGRKSS